jgi:hypothetical protein
MMATEPRRILSAFETRELMDLVIAYGSAERDAELTPVDLLSLDTDALIRLQAERREAARAAFAAISAWAYARVDNSTYGPADLRARAQRGVTTAPSSRPDQTSTSDRPAS